MRGRPPQLTAAEVQPAGIAVRIDATQRKMIDEFGELDRKMQLLSPDAARFETLKRAIKGWFDAVPPDATGIVEGKVYRLHFSARELQRRVADLKQLVAVIGLDKFLELAAVPVGALEDLVGKTRAAKLIAEARTGSRRLRAVPKRPASAV